MEDRRERLAKRKPHADKTQSPGMPISYWFAAAGLTLFVGNKLLQLITYNRYLTKLTAKHELVCKTKIETQRDSKTPSLIVEFEEGVTATAVEHVPTFLFRKKDFKSGFLNAQRQREFFKTLFGLIEDPHSGFEAIATDEKLFFISIPDTLPSYVNPGFWVVMEASIATAVFGWCKIKDETLGIE